ncbi:MULTISPECIES: sodium:calcium antiporter [Crocosphaera]|uniref:Na-Ca exchanger/integrin-beta4 n=1 Tax=Crocosphaera watsonii WH 0401 TaxID=555881 RepID=T2J8F3_CROWT|nr:MULTISPECIES: sodium:calcium antiporter [Crocosphaera]NQZ64501.1 hypothetical protein [Crocosphaera sp.]CCQ60767.1 Na-Ca exchanger/integrin-beta4 [Crocosphaera watsonii WH 0401]
MNVYSLIINGLSRNQLTETDFNFGNNSENQFIQGTFSDDDLFGSVGNDTLVAGEGSSTDGDNRLFGDQGEDVLIGGWEDDFLFGGAGNDIFALTTNTKEF